MLNRIKNLLYDTVLRLATLGPRQQKTDTILIVKTDEIGDYMLWRNLLLEITGAAKFRGKTFHFCGNKSWKTIYGTFDAGHVANGIWFDKLRFKKDLAYRYRFLRSIYMQGYDIVINAQYARDKRNDDAIVLAAKANQNIGMSASTENRRAYDGNYDEKLYTSLFEHPQKNIFEFYRNRAFTAFLTDVQPATTNTRVAVELVPETEVTLPDNYFVIFPGSRSVKRIWPATYFSDVATDVYQRTGWTAIVCGGPDDIMYAKAFCDAYRQAATDLTGKTSLIQLLSILRNAKFLLSVDTGAVHLAASVGCTVFGIFNGSQYGRFAPYPAEVDPDFHAVYPDFIESELADPEIAGSKYEFVVDIDYASVKPEKVKAVIAQML